MMDEAWFRSAGAESERPRFTPRENPRMRALWIIPVVVVGLGCHAWHRGAGHIVCDGRVPCPPPQEECRVQEVHVKVPSPKVIVRPTAPAPPEQPRAPAVPSQEMLLVPRVVYVPYAPQVPLGPARMVPVQMAPGAPLVPLPPAAPCPPAAPDAKTVEELTRRCQELEAKCQELAKQLAAMQGGPGE
jgi:hypothetical protein